MKKVILFLIATGTYTLCFSQTDIKLSDLYVPTAPGFVLADKSPSSVEKPSTPKAFGISLLNLYQGGAVEVTPFWLTNKPTYTFQDWIKKKNTIIETLNLSIATFKTDTTSNVSAGIRTQVLRIYSKKHLETLTHKEDEIIGLLTTRDSAGNINEKAIQKAADELELIQRKGIFAVEFAAALIGSSNNNSYKQLSSNKSGVWANIRWSPEKSMLDFTGVIRYSWANQVNSSDSAFLDYGISMSYEKQKFDIALEYVNRRDLSLKQSFDRFALVGNYVINDNFTLVASLGKNFAKVDNIITVFGIKFGLGNQKATLGDSE
jgi:hypothetical protein